MDMNDPRNESPLPQPEDGEFIETFKVPLSDLAGELWKLEKAGYVLCARLASLALGIDIAKRFGLRDVRN